MLVDFGLAKIVEKGGATTTGAKAMTPGFSPPEQYGTGKTDSRTDVYSLGATCYAVLTATIPEDSLERAMGRDKLTPIRKRNPRVSIALASVISRSLAVDPSERYQSIAEFASAMQSASRSRHPTVVRDYDNLQQTVIPDHIDETDGTEPVISRRIRKRSISLILVQSWLGSYLRTLHNLLPLLLTAAQLLTLALHPLKLLPSSPRLQHRYWPGRTRRLWF